MESNTDLADRRTSLETERTNLLARLGELGDGDAGSLSFDQNFADSSQVTAERGEVEVLLGSLRETLVHVEEALRRLDEGTYGSCERCHEPIAAARLEAIPDARRCMNCASLL
ncbi:MAG TPA: TraR/DksA family transcriptional regulator [Acidimicrobiales bacterium]|nr:TraR/DksA family transcriptional regulator [Acidimicrobiales bacterium]